MPDIFFNQLLELRLGQVVLRVDGQAVLTQELCSRTGPLYLPAGETAVMDAVHAAGRTALLEDGHFGMVRLGNAQDFLRAEQERCRQVVTICVDGLRPCAL